VFFDNSYQDINTDGDPDLSFDGVLRNSEKGFDTQVLFDPLEEEFDLPAALIESGNLSRGQQEIVGQKNQTVRVLKIPITDAA
jgi:hypothetical protein